MNASALLVFPIDLEESTSYINIARSLGIRVIGASASSTPPNRELVDHFVTLPYLTDSRFIDAFGQVLAEYQIEFVYTPHSGIWTELDNLLRKEVYAFKLCSDFPFETDWQQYLPSCQWADRILQSRLADAIPATENLSLGAKLSKAQYSGIHKQFLNIPGQCDADKLYALAEIMRVTPPGDLVEIGALYGRSAYALGWLAKQYGIGSLVCVDPWSISKAKGQGDDADILNQQIGVIDFDKVFNIFLSSIAMLDNAGYIREASVDAYQQYQSAALQSRLLSPMIGEINITGKIALLHIDGNHLYEEVVKDIDQWLPAVISGAWVLLDDYKWAFGDGPKRAGDELLKTGVFDIAFTVGDTLYLRKGVESQD